MNTKAGRNDPCPCGSGKKYKQCCLSQERPKGSSLLGRKINAKVLKVAPKPINLMERTYGKMIQETEQPATTPEQTQVEEKSQE